MPRRNSPAWNSITAKLQAIKSRLREPRSYASYEAQDIASCAESNIEKAIRLSKKDQPDRGLIDEQLRRAIEALEDPELAVQVVDLLESARRVMDDVHNTFWDNSR